ncbi:hypothetical protein GIB67_027239, partial [Kingdonia uniflora]
NSIATALISALRSNSQDIKLNLLEFDESETQKVNRFKSGLSKKIQDELTMLNIPIVADVVELAKRAEAQFQINPIVAAIITTKTTTIVRSSGGGSGVQRFGCGKTGRMRRDSPNSKKHVALLTEKFWGHVADIVQQMTMPSLASMHLLKSDEESKALIADFGSINEQRKINITEVIDIEEMAWAPRYGLKGMIDVSVRVKVDSSINEASEVIMPLEFKSGKGTTGQALFHGAPCPGCLIHYSNVGEIPEAYRLWSSLLPPYRSDSCMGIRVQRSDLIGLIMRRNELANDILKASITQKLPQMIQNPNICKSCRHLNVCTAYHKAHGGNTDSSGLGDLFDSNVNHLTILHLDFLRQWDRLIDLEAKETQTVKQDFWQSANLSERSNGISSVVLDISNDFSSSKSLKDGRFIYRFVRKDLPVQDSEVDVGETVDATYSKANNLDYILKSGDYVMLSTGSGHLAVSNGVIADISRSHVSVSFSRRLRLPRSSPTSESVDLIREVWRIDKDEFTTSYSIMRFNLVQLFVQSSHSSHLRKAIVDLEAPKFDSGLIVSQDPAISYIRSEKNLNQDQRRAIHKILTAKDYALILGMPGTGKTSTMVHAVKALLMRGASILLTSYTNSAVDNLLIKLKSQGIDFVRIGRYEAVHEEVRDYCFSARDPCGVEDIKVRLDQVKVVAVTCLGITHPLLSKKKFDICIMDEAGQTTLPVSDLLY